MKQIKADSMVTINSREFNSVNSDSIFIPSTSKIVDRVTTNNHVDEQVVIEIKNDNTGTNYNEKNSIVANNGLPEFESEFAKGSEDEQIEMIAIFSKIGTNEQKDYISQLVTNKTAALPVRLSAIENIDWNDNIQSIANILLEAEGGISEAVVYMANKKELPDKSRSIIDDAVYSSFYLSKTPSTQIAILNYFSEQNPSLFDSLASSISFSAYSPEEAQDAIKLIEQRNQQAIQVSSDKINL